MYQAAFYQGDYALASAWQEVPGTFIASLLDTIRNRVLKFALELQDELGSVSDDPAALPPERVDQNVINNIYGGNIVVAARVQDITQGESIVVVKGDPTSLAAALTNLGADKDDVRALELAIAEDATSSGPGNRIPAWIEGAAIKLASKGGDVGLGVAKAEMSKELTRLVTQFLGWG